MYVIIGGGKVGRRVAKKIPRPVIIEKDPEIVDELREEGFEVVEGDATDEDVLSAVDLSDARVIVATNDDFANITLAEIAVNMGAKEVVSRVEDPEHVSTFERLGITCVPYGGRVVDNILSIIGEEERRYFEINIDSESKFKDKRLRDAYVEEDCVTISIFRRGKLFRPHPDFRIKEGDVLGVLCSREVEETKKPFKEILVIPYKPSSKAVLEEARMLASMFDGELFLGVKREDVLVYKLRKHISEFEEMSEEEVIKLLKQFGKEFDLIIASVEHVKTFKDKKLIEELDFDFETPVLITKGKKEYNKVLAVVNTSDPINMLNYVRGFSQRCDVKMMVIDEESLVYKGHLVESHSTIETELVKGNPIIDVVKEAKKGYDLIMFSIENDVGNIDQDILWRIVLKTGSSVLVVK